MQTHDTQVSFRLSDDILNELRAIKQRVGIPLSEQLRRALEVWIEKHGTKHGASKKEGRK